MVFPTGGPMMGSVRAGGPDRTIASPFGGEASPMKKNYEKPAIIHTETIEARAIRCAKLDDSACPGGPVTS